LNKVVGLVKHVVRSTQHDEPYERHVFERYRRGRRRGFAVPGRRSRAKDPRVHVPLLSDAGRDASQRVAQLHGGRTVHARGRRRGARRRRAMATDTCDRPPSDLLERRVPAVRRVPVPRPFGGRAARARR